MATLLIIPASYWIGDVNAQLDAGDMAAVMEKFNGRIGFTFDATNEEAILTPELVMPTPYTGSGLVAIVHAASKTATGSNFRWDVFVEAKTPDVDTLDMETAASWATANSGSMVVAATAGNPMDLSITLTNADSVAVGDLVRFGLRRDTDHADDAAAGDAIFFSMEIADDG